MIKINMITDDDHDDGNDYCYYYCISTLKNNKDDTSDFI